MANLSITITDIPEEEFNGLWEQFIPDVSKAAFGLKISPTSEILLGYKEFHNNKDVEELVVNIIGNGLAAHVASTIQKKLQS